MDGWGNDDRLAEVERQLAELQAEVQGLRREIQRLGGRERQQPDGEMQQGPAGDVPEIVLTILVSAERSSRCEQVSPAPPGQPGSLQVFGSPTCR